LQKQLLEQATKQNISKENLLSTPVKNTTNTSAHNNGHTHTNTDSNGKKQRKSSEHNNTKNSLNDPLEFLKAESERVKKQMHRQFNDTGTGNDNNASINLDGNNNNNNANTFSSIKVIIGKSNNGDTSNTPNKTARRNTNNYDDDEGEEDDDDESEDSSSSEEEEKGKVHKSKLFTPKPIFGTLVSHSTYVCFLFFSVGRTVCGVEDILSDPWPDQSAKRTKRTREV
jgi:hypothetical protein